MALENSIWWFNIPVMHQKRFPQKMESEAWGGVCTVNAVLIFLGIFMQFLCFLFKLLESSFRINEDCLQGLVLVAWRWTYILGVITNIEPLLCSLRCSRNSLNVSIHGHPRQANLCKPFPTQISARILKVSYQLILPADPLQMPKSLVCLSTVFLRDRGKKTVDEAAECMSMWQKVGR